MVFDINSFISSIFLSIPLFALIAHQLPRLNQTKWNHSKMLNLLLILLIIRLILPFRFSFTQLLPSFFIFTILNNLLLINLPLVHIPILYLLLLTWLIGTTYYGLKFLKSYFQFKSWLNQFEVTTVTKQVKDNVEIKFLKNFNSPMAVGLLHPCILLPEILIENPHLDYILHHELLHIRRKDILFKYLYELLAIIYWWNPWIQSFRNQVSQIIEINVDSKIVSKLNEEERFNYAKLLVYLADQNKTTSKFALAFSNQETNFLYQRTHNILYNKTDPSVFSIIAGGLAIFLLINGFAFEPRYLTQVKEQSRFIINRNNTSLRKTSQGYDWYLDGKYWLTITELPDDPFFDEVPIFYSE